MKKPIINIYIVFAAILLSAMTSVELMAQNVLGVKGENNSSFGFYIKDLSSGKVCFESNSTKALVPASITKSLTSASALSILGPEFKFTTTVDLNYSSLKKGVLRGELIVNASGDPTLESEFFKENRGFCDSIASRLWAMGVREFYGTITVNDTMPDQGQVDSWTIDDTPWAYGAGHYGLNWKDNTVWLWPATGETKPVIPDFKIQKHYSKGTNLKRGFGSNTIHVYAPRKTLANKKWRVTTTMPYPDKSFVIELKNALEEYGIKYVKSDFKRSSKNKTKSLYKHNSPSIDDMLRSLMVRSDNMFAEGMLRALVPGGAREDCVAKELELWQGRGLDTEHLTIRDGSGLSRADRISPLFMGRMLEWMIKSPMKDRYLAYFPLSGNDGTMRNFCKDNRLCGRLAFKTGSMSGVQTYAGYAIDAESGKATHIVVVMCNAFSCSRASLKAAIEKLLLQYIPE